MADFVDDVQIESLLNKLHRLQSELSEEVDSLKQAAQPVKLDQQSFGRVSRGEAIQQQSMAKANLAQCQERIRQIDDALRKIDNENYGYCETCGEMIAVSRLIAKPESSFCLACQDKQEQNK